MRIEKERSGTAVPQGLEDFKTIHDHAVTLPPPGPAVRQLQRMLAVPKRLVILTVNFDELVELGHEDQLDVIVEDSQFAAAAASGLRDYLNSATVDRKVPYMKLHGTISDLSTCVASSRQTQQGLAPAKQAALEALLEADEPVRWVYVGASMRDVDLRPVLDSGAFRRGVDERWVAPFPDPNVEEFAIGREQLVNWQTVNMFERSITETADVFMTELARQWLA